MEAKDRVVPEAKENDIESLPAVPNLASCVETQSATVVGAGMGATGW